MKLVWGLAQIRCSPSDPPEVGTQKRVSKGGGNNWHEMGREGSGRADRLRTRRYKVEKGFWMPKMHIGGFRGRLVGLRAWWENVEQFFGKTLIKISVRGSSPGCQKA